MERITYFKNFVEIGREIKLIVNKYVKARVFIFGSVVKGDYSLGLSDIDIAIVSNEFKDRKKKLLVYDKLFSKYFSSPIEFHLLTEKKWNFFLRFIGKNYYELKN